MTIVESSFTNIFRFLFLNFQLQSGRLASQGAFPASPPLPRLWPHRGQFFGNRLDIIKLTGSAFRKTESSMETEDLAGPKFLNIDKRIN
jgi:hypothetical protein